MTILSTIQSLSSVIGIERPTAVYSSTEREHAELADLANEMAVRIAEAYDWNLLKRLQSYTGNDETREYPLPDDYHRMPVKQSVWTSRFDAPLRHVIDHDEWLEVTTIRDFEYVTGAFTLIGGEISFHPILETGETAQFYYMSNLIVSDEDDETQAEFTADTDTFRLPERLLRLGMVWQWKANKGLPYAEDMATFEAEMAKAVMRDKGSRILRVGRPRWPRDVSVAYPWTIEA